MAKQNKKTGLPQLSDSKNPLLNPYFTHVKRAAELFKNADEKKSEADMWNELLYEVWVSKLLLAADQELIPFLHSMYQSDKSVLRRLLESCIDVEINTIAPGEYQVVMDQLTPLLLSPEEFKELVKNTNKKWKKEKFALLTVSPSVGDSLMLKMKFL